MTESQKPRSIIGPLVVLFLVVVVGVGVIQSQDNRPDRQSPPTLPPSVVYVVEGSSGATRVAITIENDTGGTEQHEVSLPYRRVFSGFDAGDFVYISAQNQNSYGALDCQIIVGGITRYRASSSGEYSICSVSGRA
jgi:hypothetical protein